MYITKDDIVKFIHSNPTHTTMKQLYDLGLLQYQTPLEVSKQHLQELIEVDKLVKGSIEPYGTFTLTPKGMIYADTLICKEQEVSAKQTVQVSQEPLQNSSAENTNKKESKSFQIILATLPVLLAHFLPKICTVLDAAFTFIIQHFF